MKNNAKIKAMKRAYRTKWKYVLCVIPSIFLIYMWGAYPNIAVFPLSLYKWSPISDTKTWVGLHNYIMMLDINLEDTIQRAQNTLIYIAGLFFIQNTLALILSLALQKDTRKNRFFRAFFFMPMIFSSTMVCMTWNYMYDPNLGVINNILGALGITNFPGTNLMSERWVAIILIVVVHIWANIGYTLTILTSGLNTISEDVGEAAIVDGANSWQSFVHITFPLLLPTLLRNTLLTISTGAMTTEYIYMMGTRETTTWSSAMYTSARVGTEYGGVSASGVLLFFILATVSIAQFIGMKKVEDKVLG